MSQQNDDIENNYHQTAGKIGRGRLYSFLILLTAGVVLLIYGSLRSTDIGKSTLSDNTTVSTSDSPIQANKITMSESELTKEITVGGLTRNETGEVKKTYSEGEKPDQACPT